MIIRSLNLRNLEYVFETDRPNDLMTGFSGALFNVGSLLEEIGRRRRLCDEGEGSVWLDGDKGGSWDTRFDVCGPGVEFFAKIHRLDATRTKCRTNRWSWCCFGSRNHNTLLLLLVDEITPRDEKVQHTTTCAFDLRALDMTRRVEGDSSGASLSVSAVTTVTHNASRRHAPRQIRTRHGE